MKFILLFTLFSSFSFSQNLFVRVVPSDTVLVNIESTTLKTTLVNKKLCIGANKFFDLDRSYKSKKVFLEEVDEMPKSKIIDIYNYLDESTKSSNGYKNIYRKEVFLLIKEQDDLYVMYKAEHDKIIFSEIPIDDNETYLRTNFNKHKKREVK